MNEDMTARICALNDRLRQKGEGGMIVITRGIQAMGEMFVQAAVRAMMEFDSFTADNDPHGEHDFGSLAVDGQLVFWKIDYYGPDMMSGSEDPSDPDVTRRVLTIMLASEY